MDFIILWLPVYLSLPFILSGPYITNFLNFQIYRDANPLTNTIPELLGYRIELSLWCYLLCGVVLGLAVKNRQEKEVGLGIIAISLTFFLFENASLYSWYFLWLLSAYPLIRSIDSYVEVLFWFLPVFIFLVIWIPDDIFLWILSIFIILIGAVVTHTWFHEKLVHILGVGDHWIRTS